MPNAIKCALSIQFAFSTMPDSIQLAFLQTSGDCSIDAVFDLNMAVLYKCFITVVFLQMLMIINTHYSEIWHSEIYLGLANANAARMQY